MTPKTIQCTSPAGGCAFCLVSFLGFCCVLGNFFKNIILIFRSFFGGSIIFPKRENFAESR